MIELWGRSVGPSALMQAARESRIRSLLRFSLKPACSARVCSAKLNIIRNNAELHNVWGDNNNNSYVGSADGKGAFDEQFYGLQEEGLCQLLPLKVGIGTHFLYQQRQGTPCGSYQAFKIVLLPDEIQWPISLFSALVVGVGDMNELACKILWMRVNKPLNEGSGLSNLWSLRWSAACTVSTMKQAAA